MNIPLPAAYHDLEPAPVWRAFALINSIPRPSGKEAALREAIFSLARERGLETRRDERGNAVVCVPARGAAPHSPTVALQAHLDMVCQKTPDVAFDFDSQAIVPRRDGERIFASGTTLGADNGIGVAFMIALLEDAAAVHPPLELLFTVEEETGLYGASLLDSSILTARRLINLDSEEDDEITIGCAGGAGVMLFLPVRREPLHSEEVFLRLQVGGLAGGHSGVQIGERLGNSLKIAGQILDSLSEQASELRLVSLDGGTAHNAIPRDASALLALPSAKVAEVKAAFETIKSKLETQWRGDEPNISLVLNDADEQAQPMSIASTQTVLRLLRELPHGVQKMSERWEGKVQTSSNLAEVYTHMGNGLDEVELGVSNRSFLAGDIAEMQEKCAQLGRSAGARAEERDGYPGWEPRAESSLRDQTAAAFYNVNGRLPNIEVVHAGLECGLLVQKMPDLDAVSFGPTIRGAHTPQEWVSIPSVARNWAILEQLLRQLAAG